MLRSEGTACLHVPEVELRIPESGPVMMSVWIRGEGKRGDGERKRGDGK